jgi:metal-responsive CopG/Arc/MetJ family transcriptional regulator
MKNSTKGKTITIRLDDKQYQKCIDEVLKRAAKQNRIVKLSEIIRDAVEKF